MYFLEGDNIDKGLSEIIFYSKILSHVEEKLERFTKGVGIYRIYQCDRISVEQIRKSKLHGIGEVVLTHGTLIKQKEKI